jgi:hypothetical protein
MLAGVRSGLSYEESLQGQVASAIHPEDPESIIEFDQALEIKANINHLSEYRFLQMEYFVDYRSKPYQRKILRMN